MTTQINPHRREADLVVKLLDEGKFAEARAKADELITNGTPQTIINYYASYRIFEWREHDPKRAEEVVSHFNGHPYNWEYWLRNHR